RAAAERAIDVERRIVVRERQHHEAAQPALCEIAPCRGEKAPAEPETLKFRPQVQLVDFAVVGEAAGAVATVVGGTGDTIAEHQERHAAALTDRAFPPSRSAPADQLREFGARDDALIRRPP